MLVENRPRALRLLVLCAALAAVACQEPAQRNAPADAPAPVLPLSAQAATPDGAPTNDPARLRLALLARLDAEIDEAAGRAHMNARLMLDEVLPIAYLGIDADPEPGGMRVRNVWGATPAERAGLRPGDLLRAIDGDATDSRVALGRAVRFRRVDQRVVLHAERAGEELALDCTLGHRPEEDEDEAEQFPDLRVGPELATESMKLDFDADAVGSTPASTRMVLGGHGEDARYVVREEDGKRFLRQESDDPTGIRFPMAIAEGFQANDVEARVRFRFHGGRVDRAAGVVLRYHDPFNYLVARVNAAEADLRIFRVANGVRKTLPGGRVEAPCDDDQWHELVFRAEGSTLTASFDGEKTAQSCDAWFTTGGAGVWTKSDSVTDFDELALEPIGR